MAARLLSRQKYIPGSFSFYIAPLKWSAPKNASFQIIVDAAIAALQANPAVAKQLGWDLSPGAMADRVDEYNAAICQQMGWDQYLATTEGPSLPKSEPRHPALSLAKLRAAAVEAKALVRGAQTLIEFLDSGEAPVDAALSEHRAIVCSTCPLNQRGGLETWFTKPTSELIRRQIERAQARRLTTPRDAQLGVCSACLCPTKLKIWIPVSWVVKRLTADQITKLKGGKDCWILNEKELANL